jgi:aspartate carbamoyltransferase catalytic subunit
MKWRVMSLKNKDILSIRDFSRKEIEFILDKTKDMENALSKGNVVESMRGKILASLFFEPSTRTRLSFASAMHRLGGSVIGFEDIKSTSIMKGETFVDTIKIVEKYCDALVIRHPKEGAARLAAEISNKPVINAGDGSNQHPTQTLLDLYTIQTLKGKIEGLNVALVGDLKYARVMKSLAYALAMFKANLTLVSPIGLEMSKEIIDELIDRFEANIIQSDSVISGMKNMDVVYVCRIQKERFEDIYEAERIQKSFRITPEAVKQSKKDVIILHALPKITEIDPKVDEMVNAKYFQQAYYGIPIRMTILDLIRG